MNKKEFLDTLRVQLTGVVSTKEVEENIRYYDEYITDAIHSGKAESDVLGEIGSPFLIARTIIDMSEQHRENGYSGRNETNEGDKRDNQRETGHPKAQFEGFQLNRRIPKWGVIAVVVVVVFVLFSLLSSVLALLSRFFVPILVIVLIGALIRSRKR